MPPVRKGRPQSPYLIRGLETSFDTVFAILLGKGTAILLGMERNATQPVTIINKLSGKALEVEDSSTNPGARIQQTTWNDQPNQRWFIKHTKFCKHTAIPGVIVREAFRNWPRIFRLPQASYSVIADHSGLCLDIPNGSADNAEAVQQLPVNGASSQLWAFVPDKEGFNFIFNLYSGQVLDVTNCSRKDYSTVQQYPFNGEDSQRWQLFN
jgi:hypothetical protein